MENPSRKTLEELEEVEVLVLEELAVAMTRAKIDIQDLAEKIPGISRQTLGRLLGGKQPFKMVMLLRVCGELRLDVRDVYTRAFGKWRLAKGLAA